MREVPLMKSTAWQIRTEDTTHTVTYTLALLSGRMTVTVDGDTFVLSAGFLSLRAARREPFRLVSPDGEPEQAILVVDKKGRPALLFRAREVAPTEVCRPVG